MYGTGLLKVFLFGVINYSEKSVLILILSPSIFLVFFYSHGDNPFTWGRGTIQIKIVIDQAYP